MPLSTQDLKVIPTLEDLPVGELQWLIDNGRELFLSPGEYLFRKGDPADEMFIILKGKIQLIFFINDNPQPANSISAGEISGLLPYSRLKVAAGSGIATEESSLLLIHRSQFPALEKISPLLIERLIGIMTNRVREYTASQQQTEKMVSLGKLSAGLAHELNNPAAAAKRAASELGKMFLTFLEHFTAVTHQKSMPKIYEQLDKIQAWMREETKVSVHMDPIEQSSREDTFMQWMEERGVEEAWEFAPVLVSFGLTEKDAEQHLSEFSGSDLSYILKWICLCINTRQLISEVEMGTGRISEIVKAVKSYSYMDQATYQEIDIHQGIEDTITILKHKTTEGIKIERNFGSDIPKIPLYAAEINQVWTNLIDNAIDALKGNGVITIVTKRELDFAVVIIKDNGPGIPPNIQQKIFDPFFTTKPVGKGTGLGLDISYKIVKKHSGDIKVSSKPGETFFEVRLPLAKI